MKPGTITHTVAALLSSVTAMFAQSGPVKPAPAKVKLSKKTDRMSEDVMVSLDSLAFAPRHLTDTTKPVSEQYPWKQSIVTTVFWIGEEPSANNPIPNRSSSWDKNWSRSYGGFDNPDRARRVGYIPAAFTPKQNPFYCALPYNDKAATGHRPEASQGVPWVQQ